MDSKLRVEQCISECWKTMSPNIKEYLSNVSKGLSSIRLLVAHATTLKEITNAEIEDTITYKLDPGLKGKLEYKIEKGIEEEKCAIQQIINNLEKLQSNIEKECHKVFSIYDSEKHNLPLSEIVESTETSFGISEKIEALDRFKRNLFDNHNSRLFSIIYLDVGGDTSTFCECWNVSKVESLLEDLQLTMEFQ